MDGVTTKAVLTMESIANRMVRDLAVFLPRGSVLVASSRGQRQGRLVSSTLGQVRMTHHLSVAVPVVAEDLEMSVEDFSVGRLMEGARQLASKIVGTRDGSTDVLVTCSLAFARVGQVRAENPGCGLSLMLEPQLDHLNERVGLRFDVLCGWAPGKKTDFEGAD